MLGVPNRPLVVLHPGATAPLPRNYSGLYHLAIHVPTLEDFARIQARAESVGYQQYPTDHLTHYANYLDDADGNGLEMVFETPERVGSMLTGPGVFGFIDADGNPHSGREAIDLRWLRTFLPDGNLEPGMPDGAVMGHLHLRVSSMEENHAFYRDQIGFTSNMFSTEIGMYDLSAGGSFPHRLAGNIWESGGQLQRPAGSAGLRYYTLVVRSPEDLTAAVSRVAIAGGAIEQHGRCGDGVRSVVESTVADAVRQCRRAIAQYNDKSIARLPNCAKELGTDEPDFPQGAIVLRTPTNQTAVISTVG